jgi:dTDP-4-dehydrorhamnose 3,5-epimerase
MKTEFYGKIEGVFLKKYFHSIDERGSISKFFSGDKIATKFHNIDFKIEEVLVTKSSYNVIRGMHLQTEPYASNKIIFIYEGEIIDVLIDLRTDSISFLHIQEVKLTSKDRKMLYVPKGVAHGFKVISDEAILFYLVDNKYYKESDVSIMPFSINYDWKAENPIISKRDQAGIILEDFINGDFNGS